MAITILSGSNYFTIHDNGMISRPGVAPSGQWTCAGAVRCNNFGNVVQRFTVAEVLAGGIKWRHANGAQRVYLMDVDHGTTRMWCSPKHNQIGGAHVA